MKHLAATSLLSFAVLTAAAAFAQDKQGGPDGPGAKSREAGQSADEVR